MHSTRREKIVFNFFFYILVKDPFDYQGRSFLHPPQDVGVNLKSEEPPEKCFLPKKQIFTWTGHTKGVSAIRWFPHTAHLMLSCSMDSKIKVGNLKGLFSVGTHIYLWIFLVSCIFGSPTLNVHKYSILVTTMKDWNSRIQHSFTSWVFIKMNSILIFENLLWSLSTLPFYSGHTCWPHFI